MSVLVAVFPLKQWKEHFPARPFHIGAFFRKQLLSGIALPRAFSM
jgi:hypothetical protein